jgi:hypothetical protein
MFLHSYLYFSTFKRCLAFHKRKDVHCHDNRELSLLNQIRYVVRDLLLWPSSGCCLVGAGKAHRGQMCVCVCFTILLGTWSPHKDSKTRTILTSGDILWGHLGLELGVRFRGLELRLGVRENKILNGNQLFVPHKDSKTNVCVFVLACVFVCACVRYV